MTSPMRHSWVRAVVTVLWCAFAAYVTLVLAGRGDALGYVQAPGPARLKLTLGMWPPTPERDLGRSGGGGRGGRGGGDIYLAATTTNPDGG